MKRTGALLLALILFLALTGCGGSSTTGSSQQEKQESEVMTAEEKPDSAAEIGVVAPPVFVKQPEPVHFVLEGSDYAAPVFSAELALPEGSRGEGIAVQWTVNGEPIGEATYTEGTAVTSSCAADALCGKEAGVYHVACTAGCLVNGSWQRSESFTVNFIVCRGVLENAVLTFSDVHQDWDHVGMAVENTMLAHDGKIPALVIATGDWNNLYLTGNVEENRETCMRQGIERIALQLGGIDTVWVSGNHDNGYAAGFTNMNVASDLGIVPADYANEEAGVSGTGILFDSRSEGWRENADSSREANGLIVIGVNFEDVLAARSGEANGKYDKPSCDYGDGTEESDSVYKHLKTALDSVAADYHGELVVISTHAGLHVLGVDSASNSSHVFEDPDYCITNSATVVRLVNSYAEEYGMPIVWLFGHDHSKGEEEFVKLPGDTLVSTGNFDEQTSEELTLQFVYGHAGYITDNQKMSGHSRYSLLTWDENSLSRTVSVINPENDPLSEKLNFSIRFS